MHTVIVFVEQLSPDVEECSRCAAQDRIAMIWPGRPFFAVIQDGEQMDTGTRINLCRDCAFIVRDAISSEEKIK